MRRTRFVALAASVLAVTLVVGLAGTSVGATVSFGAKLDKTSQPSNAEGGRYCADEISTIDVADPCTWVSTVAYRNAGHARAPLTGTIGTIKLVSCVPGSFIIQMATPATGNRARVLRNGPTINYKGDTREICGGEDGDDYIVQSFAVTMSVTRGDYIGVYAARLGALYCAGGSGINLWSPPLGSSTAYRTRTDSTSCNLLVSFTYK